MEQTIKGLREEKMLLSKRINDVVSNFHSKFPNVSVEVSVITKKERASDGRVFVVGNQIEVKTEVL